MKLTLAVVGGILGLVLLLSLSQLAASESGEVVVLHSLGSDGSAHTTRIWMVEDAEGRSWIRGGKGGGWTSRVVANGEVEIERDDERRAYRAIAVDEPETRRRISALMREKYGWGDRWIAMTLFDPEREDSLAVRLERR